MPSSNRADAAPGGELACPAAAIDALAACREPYLIGVRHHSPALSVALPELLDRAQPHVLAIELPPEAGEWLGWLTDPAATTPLALAFSAGDGLSFYPVADFSPELVALRWAQERQVRVRCVDLAIAHQPSAVDPDDADDADADDADAADLHSAAPVSPGGPWVAALAGAARAQVGDLDETWDRLVEAPAVGSSSEQIRRAALAHGWASRQAEANIDHLTLARESAMRCAIAEEIAAGNKVAAVIGAFHAPALVDLGATCPVGPDPAPPGPELTAAAGHSPAAGGAVSGCVVGYTFAQLDSRSGYPAGIRDPGWQQQVWQAAGDPAKLAAAATRLVTEITRQLRAAGHPAGPGEAAETVRLAQDLAALRALAAPSRRELIEAATAVLAHGEVLGRGRAVAAALEAVLIGSRSGRVAPGTPVSALRTNVIDELESLGLPAGAGSAEVSVEPGRGPRDLARHVLLRRLVVARISYATPEQGRMWRGADTVANTWKLHWSAATDASIELAAPRGLTPAQIATTQLLARKPSTPAEVLSLLREGADCGSPPATRRALDLAGQLVAGSDFARSVQFCALLDDVASARLPGAGYLPLATRERAGQLAVEFTAAAVRELAGVAGSDRLEDASALAAFTSQARDRELGVRHGLRHILATGSPLMQGAALGLLLEHEQGPAAGAPPGAVAEPPLPDAEAPRQGDRPSQAGMLVSWLYAASAEQRHHLRRRLAGLLTTTGAFDTSPAWRAFTEQVNLIADAHFVSVLPALRGGCDVLDDDARSELLHELARQFGPAADLVLPAPKTVAVARYDEAARARLAALGLADLRFCPAERWRLILGQDRQSLSDPGRRLASALDELYGRPASDALDPRMRRASAGPSQVGVREWADEIEALFGDVTLEEVFGQAASNGRADVLTLLNPAQVRPSVELLTTALSLTGALPEVRLAKLRPLVAALVAGVSAQLAVQLRPALAGLNTVRPTRRRTGRVNLARTLRANLRHAVVHKGRAHIVPASPVFSARARREADWHLIVVVDVSGSMSESVVFSALTAAVLTQVRCLTVTFLAFSTEVIDFSGQVDDPLALLLEVDVGGGTDIAGAMRAARARVRVAERTLCVLISDFDEYGSLAPLLGEVSELHAAGVKLMGCAALSDEGTAVYNVGVAGQLAAAGMRVAALSPLDLARWVGQVIRA